MKNVKLLLVAITMIASYTLTAQNGVAINTDGTAPDGSAMFFVVMMSAVPRLKTDYEGNAGIAHATSC